MEINVGKRRLTYLGQILRMEDYRLLKIMLNGEVRLGRRAPHRGTRVSRS
jgi:hypothetical protein